MKKNIVVGFLGTTLDRRGKADRWEKWRPTVAVCQQEDLLISRFHLLYNSRDLAFAEQIRDDIHAVSPETEVVLDVLEFRNPWDFEEVFEKLLDYSHRLPFQRDHENLLLHITTGTHVAQICLFLLTEAGFFPGQLLQTGPGRSNQPPGSYECIDLDLSRYDSIARRFAQQVTDDISFLKSGIQTRNAEFKRLIAEVEQVTLRCSAPILLTGPTGAGKSHLARRIYALKKQHHKLSGEFVEVNCAVLRGDMTVSTLFGHRKGAFTGATENRGGLLKAADGGLLFLDEIGELGLDEQAMLLRAIEEKRYFPAGSDQEVGSDFQLICGTNRDLFAAVRAGRFREDLLARIKFWSFRLPGLAERREDIEPNLSFELQARSREAGKPVTFSSEAKRAYLGFATSPQGLWPANFRDLNNSIARLAVLAEGNRIGTSDVREEIERLRQEWQQFDRSDSSALNMANWSAAGDVGGVAGSYGDSVAGSYGDSVAGRYADGVAGGDASPARLLGPERAAALDLFDRLQLAAVLDICRRSSSLAEAGRQLFAESRKLSPKPNDSDRLRKYLQKFGLSWAQVRPRGQDCARTDRRSAQGKRKPFSA
jgi:transcriptional regulatory protein RtcR